MENSFQSKHASPVLYFESSTIEKNTGYTDHHSLGSPEDLLGTNFLPFSIENLSEEWLDETPTRIQIGFNVYRHGLAPVYIIQSDSYVFDEISM